MTSAPSHPPATVLSAYAPEFGLAEWAPLGNAGGFSGAWLWKGRLADGRLFGLRAWPARGMVPDRLRFIHDLMDRARFGRGLAFVPSIEFTRDSRTWVEAKGRLWDVMDWLPGRADFRDDPSDVRLIEAVRALAQLHNAWSRVGAALGPCPAVERRWRALTDWQRLLREGWRPAWGSAGEPDPIRVVAGRLWDLLPAHIPRSMAGLLDWQNAGLPLQPCLCDVWHDHILYQGDNVSGVVDYGQLKVDCVAVDLARLLGSLVPDEAARTAGALFMYIQMRPLFRGAEALVTLLDRTGVVIGAMNWLRWIYQEKRSYADWELVARRMSELAGRLERNV